MITRDAPSVTTRRLPSSVPLSISSGCGLSSLRAAHWVGRLAGSVKASWPSALTAVPIAMRCGRLSPAALARRRKSGLMVSLIFLRAHSSTWSVHTMASPPRSSISNVAPQRRGWFATVSSSFSVPWESPASGHSWRMVHGPPSTRCGPANRCGGRSECKRRWCCLLLG